MQHADDLDRVLDAALAKYAAVDPRTGLEERVLAHLRTEALQPPRRMWLQWSLAAGVAVVVLVAVLVWRSSRVPHPVIANHPAITIQRPSIKDGNSAPHATGEVAVVKHASTRKPAVRLVIAATAIAHPKLEQFPSPQPLSQEEIALAQYVKNFPNEAQLVAKAQEEFAAETQRIINNAGSDSRPSTSIQQER